MSRTWIGITLVAVAIAWTCAMHLIAGGRASRSHLPIADGSSLYIGHAQVAKHENSADIVLRLTMLNAGGKPLEGVEAAAVKLLVDSAQVAPTSWTVPNAARIRLTICVPSRVGVTSDRTAEAIREAVAGALDQLNEERDMAGVVGFDREASVLQVQSQPTNEFTRRVDGAMQAIKADDRRNVGEAISLALSLNEAIEEQQPKLIVAFVDSPDDNVAKMFDNLASNCREQGVSVDIFGVGGAKSENAAYAELAARCGGRYFYSTALSDLQRLVRERVNEIKASYYVDCRLDKRLGDEPLLMQAIVQTRRGTLTGEVFYSGSAGSDLLAAAEPIAPSDDSHSASSIELYFAVGTLAVLMISLAIPFVKFGRRARAAKTRDAPSKLEIGPPQREEGPPSRSDSSRKEVDLPLPTPPPAGTKQAAPSRPPPMRRGKDLR